eukprot:779993-Amphidinium_carterae.2
MLSSLSHAGGGCTGIVVPCCAGVLRNALANCVANWQCQMVDLIFFICAKQSSILNVTAAGVAT